MTLIIGEGIRSYARHRVRLRPTIPSTTPIVAWAVSRPFWDPPISLLRYAGHLSSSRQREAQTSMLNIDSHLDRAAAAILLLRPVSPTRSETRSHRAPKSSIPTIE